MPLSRSIVMDHAPIRGKTLEPYISVWEYGDLAPVHQTLTISNTATAIAKGATTIPLAAAVQGVINAGQFLTFFDADGIEKLVQLSAKASDGDTNLTVFAVPEAIPDEMTADFPAYISDRTSSDVSRSYNNSTFTTFNTGGATDGTPTGNEKSVSLNGIYYFFDSGYRTAKYCAENEKYAYLEVRKQPPNSSYATGESIKGRALITSLNESGSVDGFVEAGIEASFMGVVTELAPTPTA